MSHNKILLQCYFLTSLLILNFFCGSTLAEIRQVNVSKTYFAYYDINAYPFKRCDGGLINAIARALQVKDISVLESLLTSLLPPTTATTTTTTAAAATLAPQRVLISSDNFQESQKSAVQNLFEPSESVNSPLLYNGLEGGLPMEKSLSDGLKFLVEFFLKSTQLVKTLNKKKAFNIDKTDFSVRSLQETTKKALDIQETLESAQRAIMHLLSPTFLVFFKNLIGAKNVPDNPTNLYAAPDHSLATAVCRASEFAATHEFDFRANGCTITELLVTVMQCVSSTDQFDITSCNTDPQPAYLPERCYPQNRYPGSNPPIDMKSLASRFELNDLRLYSLDRMTPLKLDETVIKIEGFSYFLLYRAAMAASTYTSVVRPCNLNMNYTDTVLTGWKLIHETVYYPVNFPIEATQPVRGIPLLLLFQLKQFAFPKDSCLLALIIRGTSNELEWIVDTSFKFVKFIEKNAKIHEGIYTLTKYAMIDLLRGLRNIPEFVDRNLCPVFRIVVTGHSLGGALTQSLSTLLGYTFKFLQVDAVSFASPNIFNKQARDLYRKYVNGRNYAIDQDGVAQLLCYTEKFPHGTYFCEKNKAYNPKFWNLYVRNAAVHDEPIREYTKDLNISRSWITLTPIMAINVPAFLQSSVFHQCAYSCSLSAYCVFPGTRKELGWFCNSCPGIIKPIELLAGM